MRRVADPSTATALALTFASAPAVKLSDRDPDVLLDAALTIKNAMPLRDVPEVSAMMFDDTRDAWTCLVRMRGRERAQPQTFLIMQRWVRWMRTHRFPIVRGAYAPRIATPVERAFFFVQEGEGHGRKEEG
jgi:hypothetical protein